MKHEMMLLEILVGCLQVVKIYRIVTKLFVMRYDVKKT